MAPFGSADQQIAAPTSARGANQSEHALRSISSDEAFTIRSYMASDHKAVCDLFAEGMRFYRPSEDEDPWLHHGFDTYIQQCFDSDLKDIEATYMQTGGHFWVVTVGDNTIVAIVAFRTKGEGKGELCRLSVHEDYRRHGLGARLVHHVEAWAATHGFRAIVLNTDCAMTGALKLYDRLGYRRTHLETIRDEPYYYLVHYEKLL